MNQENINSQLPFSILSRWSNEQTVSRPTKTSVIKIHPNKQTASDVPRTNKTASSQKTLRPPSVPGRLPGQKEQTSNPLHPRLPLIKQNQTCQKCLHQVQLQTHRIVLTVQGSGWLERQAWQRNQRQSLSWTQKSIVCVQRHRHFWIP